MANKYRPYAEDIMHSVHELRAQMKMERPGEEIQPSLLVFTHGDDTETRWSDIYQAAYADNFSWDTSCEVIGLLEAGYTFRHVIQLFENVFVAYDFNVEAAPKFGEAEVWALLVAPIEKRNGVEQAAEQEVMNA
jgi:hypothetical protein